MAFELPTLPYERNALEPYISAETIDFHYGKHHQTYVTNLNKLVSGSEFENASLEDIVLKATGGIFNNAAQVWNHSFYWNCLTPGGSTPKGELKDAIKATFGSFESFKEQFTTASLTLFGSGWAWLVRNANNQLEIVQTTNADNPLTNQQQPLLTCDVWEHAYYVDVRNARPKYLENYWAIVNWDFVAQNFTS